MAETIRRDYVVEADYLRADLTDPSGAGSIYEWCIAKGYAVNMLLSNAGMGISGLYEKNPLEKYRRLVLLNNMAAVELTHYFLPMLKAQGQAWILYTGSMESTIAIPYKAVYTASKHFLYGFALALREELREFGVRVSILAPGPVLTHQGTLERVKSQGKIAQLIILNAEAVARKAIGGLLKNRQVIVPGAIPAFIERLAIGFPRRLKMKIFHHIFYKYRDVQG